MHREGDGGLSKSIWAQEPSGTAERKLWRAVLEQAYMDAELPLSSDGSAPIEPVLARQLLRADCPFEAASLALVCEFADVPADRVFLWARQRYPLAACAHASTHRINPRKPTPHTP